MRTLFAAVIGAAMTLSAVSANAQDWSAAASQDLQAIHDALRDNSPEVYLDRDSAQFRSWLDAGLAAAQKQPLGKVNNVAAYADALKFYTVGFHDANIALDPNWAEQPAYFAVNYPGFSTAWRGGSYVVVYNDPGVKNLPPVGAKLISCDKVAADDIAKQRLDRYEGDLTTESGRFKSAPYLLWDRANTMLPALPAKCDWDVGGRKRTIPLVENFSSPDVRQAAVTAAAPHPTGLGIETFGTGGVWIDLHSLSERQSWTPVLNQIDQNIAAIRAAPVVVIDLRGADGGSVRAGYRVLTRLWSSGFITANNPPATQITYRTSKANQDFYRSVAARLSADPITAMGAGTWSTLADALAAAAAQNQTLLTRNENAAQSGAAGPIAVAPEMPKDPNAAPVASEAPPPPPPAETAGPAVNMMKGRVLVLTDYWCSGACLFLMDSLTRLPNVQHIGTQTGADSIFIGQSTVALPSGHARIMFGDKAWLDRPRQTNVPYTPAAGLAYTGDLSDEAALKAWVGQVVGH